MKTRFAPLAAALLLLVLAAQLLLASPAQSAAFDEGYHLTFGYAYLRTGDARLSHGQNPPLTNVLLALPLLLRDDIAFPIDHPTWETADIYGFADEFLWQANLDRACDLIWLARLPAMALALLLACAVYAFTRSAFGNLAAVVALALCVFDPNLLAAGHIVGTDLGVTLFIFCAVWIWTLALKHARLKYALVAGVLAGAALSSKYTAVWLAPIILLVTLMYPGLRASWRFRLSGLIGLGAAALIVIWGTFAFSIGPIAPGGPTLPAPQYWAALSGVADRMVGSTPAFLLGQISATGFIGYYPVAFLLKTPLPTLILLVIGVVSLIARRKREDSAVWIPPLVLFGVAMLGSLNLGYRLILPVLPFALMIAGQGSNALLTGITEPHRHENAAITPRQTPWLRVAVIGFLGAWLIIDALMTWPNHLAYFNPLIDRAHDYEMLVDSNLDWGQDLIALRAWQQQNAAADLQLAYYGTARPAAYDVHANLLPGFTLNEFGPEVDGFSAYALPPGRYAISVTSLQLGTLFSRWKLYGAFKTRVPETRVGRSFLIYNLAYPVAGHDRVVVLGPVAGDLDRAALGGDPQRELIVKWAGQAAAVLDMQGVARYITRGGEPLLGFAPEVREALLARAIKLGSDASGELRLWEIDARAALSETLKTLENKPVFAPDETALDLPVTFAGGLSLSGYAVQRAVAEGPIELTTFWRVDRTPDQPLAIFVHALDRNGQISAQGDSLQVRLSTLQPGDVIAQHFTLDPMAASELAVGLYDSATGERLPVMLSNRAAFDQVRLPLP